jgi:transcriptional antiterminator
MIHEESVVLHETTVSNLAIRLALDAIEEVMGENGLKAFHNYGDLMYLLENKPDYSLDKNYTEDQYEVFDQFIRWAGLEEVRAIETKCMAKGDDTCRYEILPLE